ncbi:MAG: radical SAM protein [Candidatus Riflebacteria bacterium HGW-Riflebacteria-2]|jgi:hypothetical protein|nr:MAG: radical SAM protein [Candidatus Riflebacteria bacterium HGW-Riflebacteria-2]
MSALRDELLSMLSAQARDLAPELAELTDKQSLYLDKICPVRTLSVSLTDKSCEQNCAHCNGHYLKGMQALAKLQTDVLNDYDAVLISGGSSSKGAVPISQHIDRILALPEKLQINLHPGFQPVERLLPLKRRHPVVSFDLPGSDEVIRKIFKLKYHTEDYRQLYISYAKHFDTVPHICIGINEGKNSGEESTLDFLAGQPVKQAVFIIFRPTPGTELAEAQPPELARVCEVFNYARNRLKSQLLLGCMRPAGTYRRDVDILAWLYGIRKIVQPHHDLIKILKHHDIQINTYNNCCALNL